ncbi:MAG: hypothetical protein ACREC7_13730, partial [Methyloceanibacter sp.]
LVTSDYDWPPPDPGPLTTLAWRQRKTTFREFLESEVGTNTGPMRGREVLIEIAMIPVSLAFAATLIGVIWIAVR